MDKKQLIKIIDNFSSQFKSKGYRIFPNKKKLKYLGKYVLRAVIWDFFSYLETLNEFPVILIELIKKSGLREDRILEIENEINALKGGL